MFKCPAGITYVEATLFAPFKIVLARRAENLVLDSPHDFEAKDAKAVPDALRERTLIAIKAVASRAIRFFSLAFLSLKFMLWVRSRYSYWEVK